jgi:hypothetical protein
MVALAAANVVGVILFAAVYAAGGAGYLSQVAFLGCLAALFLLVTVLWIRTEARHRGLEPVRRVGRIAGGLGAVVVGTPILVLMPLFWLESVLPPEAQMTRVLPPIMALVLISLVLVVLVNVIGSLAVAGRALLVTRRRA